MPKSQLSLMTLLVGRPMCLDCLAEQTGMSPETLQVALALMERTLRHQSRACPMCGVPGMVYTLESAEPSGGWL